jgi:hypothetical protein
MLTLTKNHLAVSLQIFTLVWRIKKSYNYQIKYFTRLGVCYDSYYYQFVRA